MKLYETVARYMLGIIFLFGAVDGFLGLGFGIYLTGESNDGSFHAVLQHTVYFWAFLKFVEGIGAISLLFNIKPALGTGLLTPVSAVLCLFYVFDLQWYYAFAVVAVLNLVLLKAYWPSFRHLFRDYPMRRGKATLVASDAVPKT